MKQRRTEKRLSQSAAAKLAGISRPVWASIESGTSNSYETTYVGVEEALDWATGSCVAVRGGGEPALAVADDEDTAEITAEQLASAIRRASDQELYEAGIEFHEVATVRAVAEKILRNGVPGERGSFRAAR